MTVLFFAFVILAIYHFIWEGIIAPSLRFEARYELFKLRDNFRLLKIKQGAQFPDELFRWIEHGINNEIGLLHAANIGGLYKTYKRIGDFERLREEVEAFERMVNECPVQEVRINYDRSISIAVGAFFVNSGGWFIYIIPLLALVVSYGTIRALVRKLLSLSENDINNLFPPAAGNMRLTFRH